MLRDMFLPINPTLPPVFMGKMVGNIVFIVYGLLWAPVGRNDARVTVFRPLQTLQRVCFPARLSRKLPLGFGLARRF